MEVLNARSALLSNHEVLTLLRELDSDHLARTKTAIRIKKEEDSSGNVIGKAGHDPTTDDISENLRTVEVEAIQYLSADYQPTISQTSAGITKLVKDLAPFELTKAEKLQVVNLAPTEPVELYVIVEELEDRLGERMDDILTVVQASLDESRTTTVPNVIRVPSDSEPDNPAGEQQQIFIEEEQSWDDHNNVEQVFDPNEILFDDTGEGAGVEGDLDMDDD